MKKYHQQKLAKHEADDVFWQHPCWEHGHDWRVSLWAAWATTGKSTFGLRAAYALLRGPYADVRKQLRKTPTEDNQCSFKKRHSNA